MTRQKPIDKEPPPSNHITPGSLTDPVRWTFMREVATFDPQALNSNGQSDP